MKFISSGIALMIALAIFFLYTKPAYDSTQQDQTLVAQYDVALNKVAELDKVRDSLLAKNNAFDPNNLDRLQKFIPDHVDNIALILDIDGIASKYGIGLQNIDVGGSKAASGNTTDAAIHSNTSKYNSLAMKFSVQGSYDTLLAFLNDLQSSLRLVDIESINLTGSTAPTIGSTVRLYSLTIALRTYWIK